MILIRSQREYANLKVAKKKDPTQNEIQRK